MTTHTKRRPNIIDELFGNSMLEDTSNLSEGGYSISVTQTPEGTKVRAKIGKNTDANALKKQLQQKYPNARIEIEGGKSEPLIREISTKSLKKEKETNKSK